MGEHNNTILKIRTIAAIFFLVPVVLFAQLKEVNQSWIQEQMASMTLEEKIGQLFTIRAYGRLDSAHILQVLEQIEKFHVGGLCFFQGDAETQLKLTNFYQEKSKLPLLISMDAEWGLGMRLKKDGFSFPKQLTCGALKDNKLIYQMGKEQAVHLKRLGVHLNFAPVLDINNNPANPVINERSFGDQKKRVSEKSFAFMKGLQDGGVLACAKHFPGHGDTDIDSHDDLPVISHSRERLDSFELFPFRVLAKTELSSVMIAHLAIPSMEDSEHKPASISRSIVYKLLRKEFHFKGLTITDALEMKAVSKKFEPGMLELEAFKAGNDILLLSENIAAASEAIKNAIVSGEIKLSDLNGAVYRILAAKTKVGLQQRKSLDPENILKDINTPNAMAIRDKIYRNAITLIQDDQKMVPIRDLQKKYLTLSIGKESRTTFQTRLADYISAAEFQIKSEDTLTATFMDSLKKVDAIIVSLHGLNYRVKDRYGLQTGVIENLRTLSTLKPLILVVFGAPYAVQDLININSIVLAYEDNAVSQDIAAQILMGSDPISGILPITLGSRYPSGKSILRPSLNRIGFSLPEAVGMSSSLLADADSIARKLIENRAAPGVQVLIARSGKIVFEKNYGTLDYLDNNPVRQDCLYDIASLTKIIGSAPVLMHFFDQNLIDSNDRLGVLIPGLDSSNKRDIKLREVLLHQAGLVPWIPFYKQTLICPDTLNLQDPAYYRNQPDELFSIPVAEHLYLRKDFRDSIYFKIAQSRINDQKKYVYSDLGFYWIPELVKSIVHVSFEQYLEQNFFGPMGMRNTVFNPWKNSEINSSIAPSEDDHYFRHQVVDGYVHDMGSALLGGVSGHAGLFSNSRDLAVMMQCMMNLGTYGGQEYFQSNTVRSFIQRDGELGRRAMCFDMKDTSVIENGYVSSFASDRTFGHQGFTGTCVWVDPEYEIIYIFLSNRTYPNSSSNFLHRYRYRTRIQDVIYKSLKAS